MKKLDGKEEMILLTLWLAVVTAILIGAWLFFASTAHADNAKPAPQSATQSAILASIRSGAWQTHPSLGVLVTVSPADSSSSGESNRPLQIAFPVIAYEASPCGSAYIDNDSIVIESIGWRYVIDARLPLACSKYSKRKDECLSWK